MLTTANSKTTRITFAIDINGDIWGSCCDQFLCSLGGGGSGGTWCPATACWLLGLGLLNAITVPTGIYRDVSDWVRNLWVRVLSAICNRQVIDDGVIKTTGNSQEALHLCYDHIPIGSASSSQISPHFALWSIIWSHFKQQTGKPTFEVLMQNHFR